MDWYDVQADEEHRNLGVLPEDIESDTDSLLGSRLRKLLWIILTLLVLLSFLAPLLIPIFDLGPNIPLDRDGLQAASPLVFYSI